MKLALPADAMRAAVADNADDQTATDAALYLVHTGLGLRLARRRLTVIDAARPERGAG